MDINKDANKIFNSKVFKIVLISLVEIIIILLAFKAGTMLGFKRADFSYRWGNNYQNNFAPNRGVMNGIGEKDFLFGHGISGPILNINVDDSTIMIKDRDRAEKLVVIKSDTKIERFQETIKLSDLKIDDFVVIIGAPNNNGQIEAKLIRVLPSPPDVMFNNRENPTELN